MTKLKVILIRGLFGVLCAGTVCFGQESAAVDDVDIVFFGKVVDQFYGAVPDANVGIEVSHSQGSGRKGVKAVMIRTDDLGLFTLKDKGISIHIEKIEKRGYKFVDHKNPDRDFEYSPVYPKAVFLPDARSPLLFHMRKMEGEPAYLICKPSVELIFSPESSYEYNLDVVGTWIDDRGVLHRAPGGGHVDINIKCSLSKDHRAYKLTFFSADTHSGVLVSEDVFEQAPDGGYNVQADLGVDIPEKYEERRVQLYVKARGGQAYSKLELDMTVRPSNLLINAQIWTNPAGSRNLRYDAQFQKYERKRRYDERERQYQQRLAAMRRRERLKYDKRLEFSRSRRSIKTNEIQNKEIKPARRYNEYYYSYNK